MASLHTIHNRQLVIFLDMPWLPVAYRGGGLGGFNDISGALDRVSKKNGRLNFLL